MKAKKPRAIVILPTYNERENIERTVETLEAVFQSITDWRMGILVVDDTSPDKTYEVVRRLQKRFANLNLVLNRQKSGLGGAYLKGMKQAFYKLGADVVFEFDADLSHDPTKIPLFLEKIKKDKVDFVLGSRYIPGGGLDKNWPWYRKFLSIGGNLFMNLMMLNFSIRDWTSGFRAIKKEVYEAVAPHLQAKKFTGYTFQIGFLYQTLKHGFKVAEVPFVFKDRELGHSKIGPEYIKNTLAFVIKTRLLDLIKNRVFKFAVVGAIGATVQLSTLNLFRLLFPYQLSYFLSVEMAVLSNFIFNNIWTFSDRKLSLAQVPIKFIHFNFASAGSIIIQQVVALVGQYVFGLEPLFLIPLVGIKFDTGTLYAIVGILLGMSWNFFAYNKFIWKKKNH